ncbi:hypothetical protein COCSUDRAFT_53257 [Coccomyxa subellipsoidea C-169]|uniref:Uncharacterized protein n=1 Tax=Coccomyxa subellipsoidea (strain C-169) TaxID=574566 RepID=I0Z0M1_COCSC|nr:hypothetical protein COCSUDRAFT_53257 [Coccomyxa subellipsoidea C-169]EIE24190.1 hypothetical protein COCSUDRAFT_53257 [Coccomyxa subellipsoidea C-169]|eukprot:XP_005648734.1 hypothetical protein COCSUDRAFT_53257 [Coccomyxa subellipsoidea C-169]
MGAVGTTCPCSCSARPHLLQRRLGGRGTFYSNFTAAPATCRPGSGRSLRLEVSAVKGAGKKKLAQSAQAGAAQLPPTPPVDPDNAEFVLFIRAVKFPQWYPLSVVKGGSAANIIVRAMESEFGRLLYGKTLIRNIGTVVYQDRRKIENMVKRSLPMMKNFKDFEFGFKIRDKTRPNDWYFAENVTIIPPESELRGTVADQVGDWWKSLTGGNN